MVLPYISNVVCLGNELSYITQNSIVLCLFSLPHEPSVIRLCTHSTNRTTLLLTVSAPCLFQTPSNQCNLHPHSCVFENMYVHTYIDCKGHYGMDVLFFPLLFLVSFLFLFSFTPSSK